MNPLRLQPDLAQQAYDSLLEAICLGSLAAGERVTQEALAAELGVSRQPVLQAMGRLRREGFLVDAGRKGVQVAPLDLDALERVYQIRAELDGLAAALAAGLADGPRAEAVREGRRLVSEGQALVAGPATAPPDPAALARAIDADFAFHRWLYRCCGNPLIEPTLALHWQHLRRFMGVVLSSFGTRAAVWREHEAILQAVAEGDAPRARALAAAHASEASRTLRERLASTVGDAPRRSA